MDIDKDITIGCVDIWILRELCGDSLDGPQNVTPGDPHPPTHTPMKDIILSELDILRRISVTEANGIFKARAYVAAIKAIAAVPHIARIEDLPAAKGKGDPLTTDMRAKVAFIMSHGRLEIPDAARARAHALDIFQKIYGVGPKKAHEWIEEGYTTLAAIHAAVAATTLKLTKAQAIGLKYYDDINSRIPRSELDAHAALLLAAKPPELEGIIVGSYRRGAITSGDIDMLVTVRPGIGEKDAGVALATFVTRLKERGYLREVLAQGDHKCLAVAALPSPSARARRLDLLVTPPEEFPFAVFYFTGCDTFNVAVRSHALTRGYTLNEHALTATATKTAVTGLRNEADIFTFLGLEWTPPEARTGPDAMVLVK